MNTLKATQKGFTLLELMIVIAIIGIIASIAIPSYTDYLKQGMATEATATLADTRIRIEQCFQDERLYNHANCAALCPSAGTNFGYTCTLAAETYLLTAQGTGQVSNFTFSVTESNVQNSTYDGVAGAGCWKTSKTSAC